MPDKMSPAIQAYLGQAGPWQDAFAALRRIVCGKPLREEFKWGHPCYTLDGQNVVLMHGFKDYCALLFFKGALMQDPNGLLVQQTANVQAARQMRFTGAAGIERMQAIIAVYLDEAIAVERSGRSVDFKQTQDFYVAPEFQARLDELPELRTAFAALTPGRQRGYLLHFAGAKQASTREARIDKSLDRIFAGKGLND